MTRSLRDTSPPPAMTAPSLLEQLPTTRPEETLRESPVRLRGADALLEAERCLGCADAPCATACPAGVDVPGFIRRVAGGNLRGAARSLLSQSVLALSCGRACPSSALCESACVLHHQDSGGPIRIGRLEHFAAEWALDRNLYSTLLGQKAPPTGRKVALVGAGPASVACAVELTLRGHACTLMDTRALPGGLLTHGVAGFRMNTPSALRELQALLDVGVAFRGGVALGKDVSPQQLLDAHDAVFLGLGRGTDGGAGAPGEELPGVHGGASLAERIKTAPGSVTDGVGHAVVLGGGNSATDAARTLKKLGVPEVTLVYRRGPDQLGAYASEVEACRQEGVRVLFWHTAVAFRGEGQLQRVTLARTRLDGGRLGTVPGSETDIPAQMAVLAVGRMALAELCSGFPGVEVSGERVVVDPQTGATGHPRVFAGGDLGNGGQEIAHAVAEGRRAALAIHRVLTAEQPREQAAPAPAGARERQVTKDELPPAVQEDGGAHALPPTEEMPAPRPQEGPDATVETSVAATEDAARVPTEEAELPVSTVAGREAVTPPAVESDETVADFALPAGMKAASAALDAADGEGDADQEERDFDGEDDDSDDDDLEEDDQEDDDADDDDGAEAGESASDPETTTTDEMRAPRPDDRKDRDDSTG